MSPGCCGTADINSSALGAAIMKSGGIRKPRFFVVVDRKLKSKITANES
jgi:hypothetical protein